MALALAPLAPESWLRYYLGHCFILKLNEEMQTTMKTRQQR